MKKLGLLSQMKQVEYLPDEVKKSMQQTLLILEESYGATRDIEKELGGYIVVIESKTDINDLSIDISTHIPEWVDKIVTKNGQVWIQALFILSSDFAIVVVGNKEIVNLEG